MAARRLDVTDNLELKTQLLKIQAELQHRTSSSALSSDYLKSAVDRLSQISGARYADIRQSCLAKAIPGLYANGDFASALRACDGMLALGRISNRPNWLRLAHNCAGAIEGECGNFAEAMMHYHSAIGLAREMDDVSAESNVFINLGILFQYAGFYREAIPCHQKAILGLLGTVNETIAPSCYTNLAQAYFGLGDLENAHGSVVKAMQLSVEPTTAYATHSRVIREWTFSNIALQRGDIAEAGEHVEACKRYALRAGNSACAFFSKLAHGLFQTYAGSVDIGLKTLEGALAESATHGPGKRVDALVALIDAYEAADRPQLALSCLNELMQHMANSRQEQLTAVMSMNSRAEVPLPKDHYMDLHAWKYRHARLRAAVAEHELISARHEMLERLAITASLKEDASGEHGYRVGKLSALLAECLGWSPDRCCVLEIAARLHDIGKVGVPDRILLGSRGLQEGERQFMQSHTLMGAELLAKGDVPQLQMAQEVARHHHERWDGTGYPSRLAGERIPVHARIVALADVYDALTHGRPYAEAWSAEAALEEIRSLAGVQFDPNLTPAFIRLVGSLRSSHEDLDAFLGGAAIESAFLQARNNLKLILEENRQGMEGAVRA